MCKANKNVSWSIFWGKQSNTRGTNKTCPYSMGLTCTQKKRTKKDYKSWFCPCTLVYPTFHPFRSTIGFVKSTENHVWDAIVSNFFWWHCDWAITATQKNDTRSNTYIDGHHIGTGHDRRLLIVLTNTILAGTELEKNLLLANFCEIELLAIKWLENLIHSKFCGALLQMPAFIELCHESILPGNHLQVIKLPLQIKGRPHDARLWRKKFNFLDQIQKLTLRPPVQIYSWSVVTTALESLWFCRTTKSSPLYYFSKIPKPPQSFFLRTLVSHAVTSYRKSPRTIRSSHCQKVRK